jgi:cytochrome c oxidase subunit 2
MQDLLGLPPAASEHAAQIDNMIGMLHILMVALFLGWGTYFMYVLLRFRKSRQSKADYAGARSHASTYLEVLVAVIEGVLLVGFAVPIWASVVTDFPSEEESTVVRVVAEQFAWNVHYPGADGVFGRSDIALITSDNPLGLDRSDPACKDDIATINQLNLPVDKPVIVHLSSKDVIHSFGIPVMRVKQDAIPGQLVPLWFTPRKTGEYEIACAQLCGLGHYRMRGFVTVQTADEFQAWLNEEASYLEE